MCPNMSLDFDLCLSFDLNIGVNVKFGGYIFYASQKFDFYFFDTRMEQSMLDVFKCTKMCRCSKVVQKQHGHTDHDAVMVRFIIHIVERSKLAS